MLSLIFILIALPAIHAIAVPNWHDLSRSVPVSNPSQAWYHPSDHPVNALFRRTQDDGAVVYASVGSPEWSSGFPPPGTLPDPSTMPAAWVDALNSAVAAGKIPNVPLSSINTPGTNPVYPNGLSPTSSQVCSGTYKCRIPGDVWDSPNGVFASAFDDGPTPSTPTLVEFLQSNNEMTTHFMIGSNILYYPNQFMTAFNAGHDIADHTFTHPYLTTKNNLDVVGELGWTMQLIANSTGGRVPKFWRPPYGDTDLRVSAIAREVFSLTTVVWNQDSEDWAQTNPGPIVNSLQQFLTGPKSPGLIVLEHELTPVTVTGFMNSYYMIKANGWNFQSLAQVLGGGSSYTNAQNSTTGDVTPVPIVASVSFSSSSSSSTASPSATAEASNTNLTTTAPSPKVGSGTTICPCPSTALFLMTLFSVTILLCL